MSDIIEINVDDGSYHYHKSAIIDKGASIGKGTKIWHFCHISEGAVIGENCNFGQNIFIAKTAILGNRVKVQNNVSIYDRVIIEDDVFCGPSMVFTNVINPRSFIERKNEYKTTLLKKGSSVGANATILCGVTVGRYALIGAGSVVTKDVPDHAVMVGVPAKRTGWVCYCGVNLDKMLVCPECGKKYKKINENEIQEN